VADVDGHGIPDVTVSAGAGGNATTDGNGAYTISGLAAGTYTLTPSKSGYSFTPVRRTVSVSGNVTGQDFRGVADGGPTAPFLDLPFNYDGSETTFIQTLENWSAGGKVTSWFDHKYPDGGHGGGEGIWLYKGDPLTQKPEWKSSTVLCYDDYCYDGHNGTDFAPSTTIIRPAASGTVVEAKIDCQVGDYSCGGGYGNYVVVDHGNGYFTRYAHLKEVYKALGQPVTVNDTLGIMGNTGNSTGTHLHFGLYRDSNGNGAWDSGTDKVADPYGWKRDVSDPWVVDRQGSTSYRLWLHDPDQQTTFAGSQGAVVSDSIGSTIANIPPGAVSGQATLELSPGPVAGASAQLRTTGQSFWLRLLEWLPGSGGQVRAAASPEGTAAFTLTQPITLTVAYSDTDVLHLDVSRLALRLWDEGQGVWQTLPTVVDPISRVVTATSQYLGDFDLQAPLLCASDALEPDDGYPAATPVWPNDTALARGLDIPQDHDWVRFYAAQGISYTIRTQDLAGSADTVLNLYDLDGLTLLASNDNAGSGPASELTWTAPYTGTYFAEVISAPGGVTNCLATYRLSITTTASLRVSITRTPEGATLTWPHSPQYAGYQVRRNTTPYFMASDWSELLADVPAPGSGNTASFTDASAFNSAAASYFYVILPTDADGQPYLVSNRVGAFNFALTPGGN
jgi:murein DD-endopeptidase MepM/ murein hydrolase activator NlpD